MQTKIQKAQENGENFDGMKRYGSMAVMEIVTSSALYQQLEKKLRVVRADAATQYDDQTQHPIDLTALIQDELSMEGVLDSQPYTEMRASKSRFLVNIIKDD